MERAEHSLELPPVKIPHIAKVYAVDLQKSGKNIAVVILKGVDGGLFFRRTGGLDFRQLTTAFVKPQQEFPKLFIGRNVGKNYLNEQPRLVRYGNITVGQKQLKLYPFAEVRLKIVDPAAVLIRGRQGVVKRFICV